MVHSFFFSRIFSLKNSSHSEKQMVTVKSMTSTSEMRNSFDDEQGDEEDEESHCQPNPNPLKICSSEADERSRWSSSCPVDASCKQWSWIAPEESESCSSFSYCQWGHPNRRKRRIWLTVGVASVILVTFVTILVVLLCPPDSFGSTRDNGDLIVFNVENNTLRLDSDNMDSGSSSEFDSENENDNESDEESINVNSRKLDLKQVSRLSWNLLNSNNDNSNTHPNRNQMPNTVATLPDMDTIIENEGEVILPAKMVYTSTGGSQQQTLAAVDLASSRPHSGSSLNANGGTDNKKKRSCCRTQKYSQVIKRDGCEPVTIVNKMCFGQCVSVWVPGLFASFPVCRPSRSHWKVLTLKCGPKRDKRKRVRVERVRRCSCMEIEPTTSGVAMNLS